MAGRPHMLADPDFCARVAACFVEGMSRQDMCNELGIRDVHTITRWRRDPRVKVIVRRLTEDRIRTITSKTDTEIQKRLNNPENLTVKEILEIRKEFLGGAMRAQTEAADEGVVNEAMEMIENNPDFVEQLNAMMAAAKKTPDA